MDTGGAPDTMAPGAAVRDVVRAVVAEVAPEELALVDGLRGFDDDTVVTRLTARRGGGDALGFGLEEVVCLVTPVLWVALDECARRVVGGAVDRFSPGAGRRIGRVLRRRTVPLAVPALNDEQVAEVRRRILELSAQTGVEAARAEVLADRVALRLLLPPDPTGGGNDGGEDGRNTPA